MGEMRFCLTGAAVQIGCEGLRLWHNSLNGSGDGHLDRPINRSAAAAFPLEEPYEEIE
jgi:hypothetical protein